MDNKPYFSIITCTYNSSNFLGESIASVERQKFKNFEHIFIDAFSTDSTPSIIQSYQARRPDNVRFYQHPPKGISNAMNLGIGYAKGEVLLFLHSDDYLYTEEVLGKVAQLFGDKHPDVLVGNCLFKNGEIYEPMPWSRHWLTKFFLQHMTKSYLFFANGIPHPSTYMKKSVFEKYGGFKEDFKAVMDYELWFRTFNKVKVGFTNEILSVYRYHEATTSNILAERGKQEIARIFKEYSKEYWWEKILYYLIIYPFVFVNRLVKKTHEKGS